MLTHTKRFFQLSGITVFASMLVLGAAATASADHDDFDIKVVIKEECEDGVNKPIKRTIKSEGFFQYDPTISNPNGKNGNSRSPFPFWDKVDFDIDDFDGVGVPESFDSIIETLDAGDGGVALSKNLIKGSFQTFVDNDTGLGIGNRVLSLSGTVVADKDGNGKIVVGKINGYDTANGCTYTGKFKGKRPKPSEDPS